MGHGACGMRHKACSWDTLHVGHVACWACGMGHGAWDMRHMGHAWDIEHGMVGWDIGHEAWGMKHGASARQGAWGMGRWHVQLISLERCRYLRLNPIAARGRAGGRASAL